MPVSPSVVPSGVVEYCSLEAWTSFPLVPLWTPGWKTIGHAHLYGIAPLVGEDRAVPGVDGRLPIDREFDEWPFDLHLKFNGEHDRTGAAVSDAFAGVRANVVYVRDNCTKAKTARPFKFHMASGSSVSANVIVTSFETSEMENSGGRWILGVLGLVVPASVMT